jgi:hypothetical protein
MPITTKCANAACGKTLQVKDELAGKNVRCPGCGTVIPIPALDQPDLVEPAPVADVVPAAESAPTPAPAPAPALGQALAIPLYVGLGGLGFMFISCILPWISLLGISVLGVNSGSGILLLLLSLAAGVALAVGAFVKRELLPLTLVAGAGTGTFGFITFFVFLIRLGGFAAFGIYLGFLASLAAGGALTFASIKNPYRLPLFDKQGSSPVLRDFGGFIGAQAVGFVLGLIVALVSLTVPHH